MQHRPPRQLLSVLAAASLALGLVTCVVTPAQEPSPRPAQAALLAGSVASLPALLAPGRAPAADVPSAVPVDGPPETTPDPDPDESDVDLDPADPGDPDADLAEPEPDAGLEHEPLVVEDRLREIFWTVPEDTTLAALAPHWGVKLPGLMELNPGLVGESRLSPGTRLRVYRHDPSKPTLSIGSPNRGKLRNGMPLPEGPGWRLRTHRPRTFGAVHTIAALVDAFESFGATYPAGPKIRIGEIARRTGGRVPPHSSHRSGRDIDIGYIFRGIDDGEHRWQYMNTRNFDAEKNWALIQAILRTGQVQTIYVSKKLQKLLHKEAKKHLGEAELAEIFEYPLTSMSPHAKIQHWRGHSNHMHVRFQCEDGNRRCRARQRPKPKPA